MTPRKLLSRQLSKPEVDIVLDVLKAGDQDTSYNAGHPGVDSLVRRGWLRRDPDGSVCVSDETLELVNEYSGGAR